ncbi:MAG TPA: protein kinase, partial [Thermoleophilaceae bacterium]|nr:protein kinase [Thermoleophilaceae bacterium]
LEAQGLTATGRVLGTTDYVSPEQALGHEVTGQSDIYSLGIVLYEMLTGETPFQADTQVAVAMKHVRDPLPDAQRRRPEISSALAAVVDRSTAKETQNRYQTIAAMVHDLEEVLAIEAARSGQTTGEATTVLQSLSGDTADFLPIRLRRPKRALALTVLVLALLAATAVFLATRTEKGTGGTVVKKPAGLSEVRLASDAAHDYDPAGDGHESEDATRYAIDGVRGTNWNTERYEGGFAGNNNKPGVGIYVDAGKPIAARGLALVTGTPRFKARVYASETVPESIAAWVPVSPTQEVQQDHTFRLKTKGRKFTNYLLWITELPEQNRAEVQELSLLK